MRREGRDRDRNGGVDQNEVDSFRRVDCGCGGCPPTPECDPPHQVRTSIDEDSCGQCGLGSPSQRHYMCGSYGSALTTPSIVAAGAGTWWGWGSTRAVVGKPRSAATRRKKSNRLVKHPIRSRRRLKTAGRKARLSQGRCSRRKSRTRFWFAPAEIAVKAPQKEDCAAVIQEFERHRQRRT